MKPIDIYSSAGQKVKTMELPASLFEGEVNWGLMHQAVVMIQSNRRQSPAHTRTRGEVWGSTKKLFQQKHTGKARRGDVRSPTLRGGGKAFGPRNNKNYLKDMPQKMRHAALRSALAAQATKGTIMALENYPTTIKTKTANELLKKLPVEAGRRILFVLPGKHDGLQKSFRNISSVKCAYAAYLGAEDLLKARAVVFLVDAFKVAEEVFGKKTTDTKKTKASKQNVKEVAAKPAKSLRSKTAKKAPKTSKTSKKAS